LPSRPATPGPVPGPNARAIIDGDERYVSPATPVPIHGGKRGRGLRVEDVDGNEFLDFAAGIAVVSTGHCTRGSRRHTKTGRRAYPHLRHRFLLRAYGDAGRAALGDCAHAGPHRFYYGNSGAEAIECALKLARYHMAGKTSSLLWGFHGRTMGALSLTLPSPRKAAFCPTGPGGHARALSYAYRGCSGDRRKKSALRWLCPLHRRETLQDDATPEEVAAIFVSLSGRRRLVVAPISSCRSCAGSATSTAFCCGRRGAVGSRTDGQMVGG